MSGEQQPQIHSDDSEYEEIAYEEVDRVCASLEELRDSVQSENIQAYFNEAINSIQSLVYEETCEDDQDILPFSDAA